MIDRIHRIRGGWRSLAALALAVLFAGEARALSISRFNPSSELFSTGSATPMISRFVPGQRFDLQATVRPDAGQSITAVTFSALSTSVLPSGA